MRQHYVSRFYLKPWANEKQQIPCIEDNRLFTSNLMDVAQEKDFYAMKKLSDDDILYLKNIIVPKNSTEIVSSYDLHFSSIQIMFEMKNILKLSKLDDDLLGEIEEEIKMFHEKTYSKNEREASKIFRKLREGNNNLSERETITFFTYIGTQYTRTNKMRISMVDGMKKNIQNTKYKNVSLENIYQHISDIYGLSMADYMKRNNYKIIFLHNSTAIHFITTDQPIINISYKLTNDIATKQEEAIFYMPLTPILAMLITGNQEDNDKYISDENEIETYNMKMLDWNHQYIFSDSKQQLNEYLKDKSVSQK